LTTKKPTAEEAPHKNRNTDILSPLRYPGGKRRLTEYIANLLKIKNLRPKLLVEPFSGGASMSLYLLKHDLVDSIALGEKDPLVADFWKTVFYDHKWLINKINKTEPTFENWLFFKKSNHKTVRERALACIFLNRTSFSGLLTQSAGPLGGYEQKSAYKIDCRYAREKIIYRIEQLSALADRVRFIQKSDWHKTIQKTRQLGLPESDIFYYLDPPYFDKAKKLYRVYFSLQEHKKMAGVVQNLESPWLLSYDAAPAIISLYNDKSLLHHVEFLYSINKTNGLPVVKELVISNLKTLPGLSHKQISHISIDNQTAGMTTQSVSETESPVSESYRLMSSVVE